MAHIICELDGKTPKGGEKRPSHTQNPSVAFILAWYFSDATKRVELASDMMSAGEIDARVRDIKTDLDRAAKRAKRLLAAAQKRKTESLR